MGEYDADQKHEIGGCTTCHAQIKESQKFQTKSIRSDEFY